MSLVIVILEAFLSIMVPGFFLALALLRKTHLSMFEIAIFGFIFGLIFPPALVWLEGYLIPYIHFFSFSETLYNANVILLTIIGVALSFQQGAFKFGKEKSEQAKREEDYRKRISDIRAEMRELNLELELIKKHEEEEKALERKHESEEAAISSMSAEEKERIISLHKKEEKELIESHEAEERLILEAHKKGAGKEKANMNYLWLFLLFLMFLTFATRIANISVAPRYFEFDPYFDMISTEYILTYGYQLLHDHSAWPTVVNGTVHRIQPIVPYLEAYWYDLANVHPASATSINTNLLSLVSGWYPPITAALLVFVVFFFLYHEYGKFPALIGATLAASMPALVTTFIAGEQLLEPWGIFAMFFFYATYIVAVKYMKEPRFAILAGIAYASTFLGAHYYTVNAGVLAAYIIAQGVVSIIRSEGMKEFYKMNIIVIIVFSIFYILYAPYSATLTERTPSVIGIPIIIAFPLFALIFVILLDYLSKLYAEKLEKNSLAITLFSILSLFGVVVLLVEAVFGRFKRDIKRLSKFSIFSLLVFFALLLIIFTPLGVPFKRYVQLSTHFITPSIPLFMTVQEYAPTGFNFNFGSAGFGIIGISIGGVNIVVWFVLALFTILELLAIYYRNSKTSIMALAAVWPLAVAGMIEVKYLPHFGVGYIIAIGAIIGEFILYIQNGYSFKPRKAEYNPKAMKALYGIAILVALSEAATFIPLISAIANPNCTSILNSGNAIGYTLFCNLVPNYWLNATAWMRANVGPFGPRILSWWDYGDWINWFGNSNAVLRGDNAVATLDYAAAAQYVLGPADGYGAKEMASFMNNVVHAKYLLLDDQLLPKWGALDFLACIHVNETNMSFAESQGALVGQPYRLGTSTCELNHDPVYAMIPVTLNNINNYCTLSNATEPMVKAILLIGNQVYVNGTYCIPTSLYNATKPVNIYYSNGTKISNAFIVPNQEFYFGTINLYGQTYADFMVVYTPNGSNYTVTNAPTEFYNSNYYRGFFFGELPGFTRVYPSSFTGINYMNSTNPIVILALNNYTGGLPYVTPKPSWVHNNYSMPG